MKDVILFKIAAWMTFVLAIGHILCMPWLDKAFELYGIEGVMNQISAINIYLPYIITIIIAICFALCGFYALSAAGNIRRLPMLWLGVFTIAGIFLFRTGIGCFWMLINGTYPLTDLSSVVVSGSMGLLFFIGGVLRLKNK